MKKALSLLLALTLIFAMAAPASAAYTGRFSRDGTYKDIAYLLTAVCATNTSRASVAYNNSTSGRQAFMTVYLENGGGGSYWSGVRYTTASVSQSSANIEHIFARFEIEGTEVGGATVYPG